MKTARQSSQHSLPVGENVFVRTVTYHYTGKLVRITASDIVLESAAWVADSGRWSEALKTGVLNEVEPFPGAVIINRAAIVDVSVWNHALPRDVK